MKCGIVKLSTVAKYGRLDPGFFLGNEEFHEDSEEIERAKKRVKQARRALRLANKKKRENKRRVARMIDDGEVVPLDTGGE